MTLMSPAESALNATTVKTDAGGTVPPRVPIAQGAGLHRFRIKINSARAKKKVGYGHRPLKTQEDQDLSMSFLEWRTTTGLDRICLGKA